MTGKPPCTFEGCTREEKSKGLCDSHYHQMWRGAELTPLRTHHKATARGKTCAVCGVFKPRSGYYKFQQKNGSTSLMSRCIECHRKTVREGREAARAARREATEGHRAPEQLNGYTDPNQIKQEVTTEK